MNDSKIKVLLVEPEKYPKEIEISVMRKER